jgi:cytochrome c2
MPSVLRSLAWVGIGAATAALAAGCGESTSVNLPGARATQGRQDILHIGCGACHQISGISTADGTVGPSLESLPARRYIAGGELANTPRNVARWIMHPQEIRPGGIMPDLGVDARQAADIAAYLYQSGS